MEFKAVYNENSSGNLTAVTLWQKKYGVLKASYLAKLMISFNLVTLLLAVSVMLIVEKLDFFSVLYNSLGMTALNCILVYHNVKHRIVREIAYAPMERYKEKKQITLKDEYFEILSPYHKSIFYYDEVEACFDKNGILTIIIDPSAFPYNIPAVTMKNDEYSTLCSLLAQKTGSKFYGSTKREEKVI